MNKLEVRVLCVGVILKLNSFLFALLAHTSYIYTFPGGHGGLWKICYNFNDTCVTVGQNPFSFTSRD